MSIALPEKAPDVASAIVLADPNAAGYTLTQGQLASELGLPQADVSVLARAFRLDADTFFAVRVPRGKRAVVLHHGQSSLRGVQRIA